MSNDDSPSSESSRPGFSEEDLLDYESQGEVEISSLEDAYEQSSTSSRQSRSSRSSGGAGREGLRGELSSIFRDLIADVSSDEVRRVLRSFEAKLERARQSSTLQKIDRGLRRARLFYKMVRATVQRRISLPWTTFSALVAALVYFINPLDLIPDMLVLGGGLVDDATVIYLCYQLIEQDLKEFVRDFGLDPVKYGLEEVPGSDDSVAADA